MRTFDGRRFRAVVVVADSSFGTELDSLIPIPHDFPRPSSPHCPARNAHTPDEKAEPNGQANRHQNTRNNFGVMCQTDNDAEVLGEPGSSEHPNYDPERCAKRIEQHETPPRHPQYSCDNAVELAQNAEKSREYHGRHAEADVDRFDPFEAFVSETDL